MKRSKQIKSNIMIGRNNVNKGANEKQKRLEVKSVEGLSLSRIASPISYLFIVINSTSKYKFCMSWIQVGSAIVGWARVVCLNITYKNDA